VDQRDKNSTPDDTTHHDEAPAPRGIATATAMFLPAVIVFTIALIVILLYVLL